MQHKGEIVEKAIRESGYSITKLAKKMGKSRRWMYLVFDNTNVSLDIIIEIGKIIHYDFSDEIKEFSRYKNEAIKSLSEEPTEIYAKQQTEIELWKNKYLVLLEHVEGKTLKSSLRSGQALSRAMLLDRPLVRRGDLIELALRSKSIRLRVPARAEEAGSVGDRITCRNLESGRRVVATIVDEKRAEVTFIP